VTQVPVVGDIVSGIGLDETVNDIGGTVDDTLDGVVGGAVDAVEETGSTIGKPSSGIPGTGIDLPTLPSLPDLPVGPSVPEASGPSHQPTADADVIDTAVGLMDAAAKTSASVALHRGTWSATAASEGAQASAAGTSEVILSSSTGAPRAGGATSSGGGLCLPASSSAGPGGAGPGAWAFVVLDPLDADRAWVRRAGPEDEHAPPAPVASTDVSPD